ncbi:hypothetical protein E2C01_045364 [Portunus trituberculatus]|uniref:Uncharacterized protein n=1 Tax=Portunus trituberculatus TaxID=210409 RepID=A0A5B7G128_PORTR|nr:hypothetical protein [Portunus trituberculatus]
MSPSGYVHSSPRTALIAGDLLVYVRLGMSGSKPQVMRLLLPLVAVWLALPPAALPCEYRSIDPRHTMCAFGARQCPGKNMLQRSYKLHLT